MQFSEFPSNAEAPLFGVELDRVYQDEVTRTNRTLIVGQKTSSGTATAGAMYSIRSAEEAAVYFGRKSQLYRACKRFLQSYPTGVLRAVGIADNGSGTAAVFTVTIGGPATADGTLTLYLAGQRLQLAVTSGDADEDIADALNTAIGLMPEIPFTATVSGAVVTLTAVHKGLVGNVAIRKNHRGVEAGEALPAGVTCAISQTTQGATQPTVTSAFTNIGDEPFRYIIFPWTDGTSLTAIQDEMERRWGPTVGRRGHAFTGLVGSYSTLTSAGDARTIDSHITFFGFESAAASPAYELAAAAVGCIARVADNDAGAPARGQKLSSGPDVSDALLGAPRDGLFDWEDRNGLYASGVSPLVSSGWSLYVERVKTLYKNNPTTGLPDRKFRDVTTMLALCEMVDRIHDKIAATYPAHKIVEDGVAVRAGIKVVRPSDIRSLVLAEYQEGLNDGLVRNLEEFKTSLEASPDPDNVNRINFLAPLHIVAPLYQVAGLARVKVG